MTEPDPEDTFGLPELEIADLRRCALTHREFHDGTELVAFQILDLICGAQVALVEAVIETPDGRRHARLVVAARQGRDGIWRVRHRFSTSVLPELRDACETILRRLGERCRSERADDAA